MIRMKLQTWISLKNTKREIKMSFAVVISALRINIYPASDELFIVAHKGRNLFPMVESKGWVHFSPLRVVCILVIKFLVSKLFPLSVTPGSDLGWFLRGFDFFTYLERQAWANSVDPNQTPQNTTSDQGLHCFPLVQQCLHIHRFIGNKMDLLKRYKVKRGVTI